jgi:hypothetical protein
MGGFQDRRQVFAVELSFPRQKAGQDALLEGMWPTFIVFRATI